MKVEVVYVEWLRSWGWEIHQRRRLVAWDHSTGYASKREALEAGRAAAVIAG